jgi:hypothetical protein
MTKDDIVRMAREAKAAYDEGLTYFEESDLHRFAKLVAAAEREDCAKLCLETEPFYGVMFYNAIRARGNT